MPSFGESVRRGSDQTSSWSSRRERYLGAASCRPFDHCPVTSRDLDLRFSRTIIDRQSCFSKLLEIAQSAPWSRSAEIQLRLRSWAANPGSPASRPRFRASRQDRLRGQASEVDAAVLGHRTHKGARRGAAPLEARIASRVPPFTGSQTSDAAPIRIPRFPAPGISYESAFRGQFRAAVVRPRSMDRVDQERRAAPAANAARVVVSLGEALTPRSSKALAAAVALVDVEGAAPGTGSPREDPPSPSGIDMGPPGESSMAQRGTKGWSVVRVPSMRSTR
jgi:hypothetical protein